MEETGISRRAEENSGIFTRLVWRLQLLFFLFPSRIPMFCHCSWSFVPDLYFTVIRSWLHSARHQCDPAEGVWSRRDSWGKWWKVQSRLHQHRASRLPQVPSASAPLTLPHLADGRWSPAEVRFGLNNISRSRSVFGPPGNRRPKGTVSGFQRCPTALITWTLCPARPPSTAAG